MDQEAAERKKETADLRERLDKETADLKDKLDKEVAERKVSDCIIRLHQTIHSFGIDLMDLSRLIGTDCKVLSTRMPAKERMK